MDETNVMGDPGDAFKAKARIMLSEIDGLPPISFTALELVEVAWIIAQGTAMLWECCGHDPVKMIDRVQNLSGLDKIKLFFLVRRSGYSRPLKDLIPRLKALAGLTPASEIAFLMNSGGTL